MRVKHVQTPIRLFVDKVGRSFDLERISATVHASVLEGNMIIYYFG